MPVSSRVRRRSAALLAATALCLAPTFAPASAAPTPHDELPQVIGLDVTTEVEMLDAGKTTSVDLVSAYLDRIEAYDDAYADQPGLKAVVTVSPTALANARLLDAEREAGISRGPLHGVPVLVKDNYATYDMPTSAGSVALADYQTAHDSTAVARLRAAGAIIIGKTNMAEFAWHGTYSLSSVRGRTANPYNQEYSASGSSGGTGAAIAASFAAAGLGTDSCGSIIGPSAHQSLVGYRPTMGLTSVAGIVPLSVRQDVSGPMTTTVEDAALLGSVLAGVDPADPQTAIASEQDPSTFVPGLSDTALQGKRIGSFHWDYSTAIPEGPRPGTDEVTKIVDQAVDDLADQGAEIVDVPFTREFVQQQLASGGWIDMRSSVDAFFASTKAEWPAGLAELTAPADELTFSDVVADGRSSLDKETLDSWLALADVPNPDYDKAVAAQEAGKKAVDAFFEQYDLDALAMPTSEAPANEDWAGTTFCDVGANTGIPSISLPAGFTAAGLPVGLELAAPRSTDATLLAMAYDYEQATDHRLPPASTPELPRNGVIPKSVIATGPAREEG
ncbi:amidase [Kineococcus rubinsiae]|uniref:amidase n=1 Tax=Kineococcus rubinsiae TaxID=2609562 RepID=UPI00143124F3|nr:amidase [Kineococcus rubinsiae]NIZ90042.1 amidase [Kineococcus rubinsiae]